MTRISDDRDTPADHDALVARVLDRPGVVLLLGDVDTGKTSLARRLLTEASAAGLSCAYLDADLGQPVAAEPGVVGLLHLPAPDGGDREAAAQRRRLEPPIVPDARSFVGSLDVTGHGMALISATAHLLIRLRAAAQAVPTRGTGMPDLVVVDTPGFVAGVAGQELAFHLMRLVAPDHVVGLARGLELEQVLGVTRRFSRAEVLQLEVASATEPKGLLERVEARRAAFARVFGGELHRFRVRPGVFMPAIASGLSPALLHRLVVGLEDGNGGCPGIGLLEADGDGLRLITPVATPPSGLRLGSIRLAADFTPRPVDLRQVLQSA